MNGESLGIETEIHKCVRIIYNCAQPCKMIKAEDNSETTK